MNNITKKLILLFLLVIPVLTHANIIKVDDVGDPAPSGGGVVTLRNAITLAAPGDTIIMDVSGSINLLSPLVVNKQLYIYGAFPVHTEIFGGSISGSGEFFSITTTGTDTVFIAGFKFTGGDGNLGAVFASANSVVSINYCLFKSNSGSAFGQGVTIASNASAGINNCSFVSNSTTNQGGAISLNTTTSFARILNCTFTANSSPANGGAINSMGILKVGNCTFVNNTSGSGTDIRRVGGSVEIYNNIFSHSNPSIELENTVGLWNNLGGNVYCAAAATYLAIVGAVGTDIYAGSQPALQLKPTLTIDGFGLEYFKIDQQTSPCVDNGVFAGTLLMEDCRRAPRVIYGDNAFNPDAGACEFTPFTIKTLGGPGSFSNTMSFVNASVSPGPFYIDFDIPAPGTTFLGATVAITKNNVFIDGYTQPSSKIYGPGPTPLTVTPFFLPNELSGPVGGTIINATGTDLRIEGLTFTGSGNGVVCSGGSNYHFYGNRFYNLSSNGIDVNTVTDVFVGSGKFHHRNLISGNTGSGINAMASTNVNVQGNFIGVNEFGIAAASNNKGVIFSDITNGSIGGNNFRGQGNIISGNLSHGIDLSNPGGVKIFGNYIGLDFVGENSLSNGVNGIHASSSVGTSVLTIGKATQGFRNYICNNDPTNASNGAGIKIENYSSGSVNIHNNSVGLSFSGVANPNGTGVTILNSQGVIMGDGTAAKRNVISGNTGIGIYMEGAPCNGNFFNKNFIGIKPDNTPAPNGGIGFHIVNGAQNNTIINHVISNSGNGAQDGVHLNSAGTGNNISGNFIGTDSTGNSPMPNFNGIMVENGVAGTNIASNIISGNSTSGIFVQLTPGVTINSNTIGVNFTSAIALSNLTGIYLLNSDNYVITNNIISGNTQDGIFVDQSNNGSIRSNLIGTNAGGIDLNNGIMGIVFTSSNTTNVGGLAVGDYNTIAFNANEGIYIDKFSFDIGVLGNSIKQHGGHGISLDNVGGVPLPNDINDTDILGAGGFGNAGQNTAANLMCTFMGPSSNVSGTVNVDDPSANYYIQIYKVLPINVDATGFGEGDLLVGSTSVIAPGSNNFNFLFSVTGLALGDVISATCSKYGGTTYATSEFSDTALVRAPLIASIVDSADVTCNGAADGFAQVGTSGGIGPYTYAWYTSGFVALGVTTDTIDILGPGSYLVIVTDIGCGCSDTSDIVTITQPLALNASATPVNATCNGICNGSITILESGGVGPYQYSINNGSTFSGSNSFTGLCAGPYQFLVQDANGCLSPAAGNTVNIAEPAALIISPSMTPETCDGLNDGTITFSALGGTPPYQYSIDGGSSYFSASSFGGVPPGTYNWSVIDTNGCSVSGVITVGGGTIVTAQFTSSPACENIASAINDASTTSVGTITGWSWTFTGGSPSASVLQNNTVQFPVAGSQNVTLIATASDGCTDTITQAVTILDNPYVLSGTDTNICIGIPFTFVANILGGTGPFSISWTPAGNLVSSTVEDPDLTTAAANTAGTTTYIQNVSDVNGCVGSDTIIVIINNLPSVNGGADQTICLGGSATLTGAGSALTYSWDNSVSDGISFNPTSTLDYIVTGIDGVGCQNTDTVQVIVETPFTVNAGTDFTICNTDATLTLNGSSSASGVTWATPDGGGSFSPSANVLNPTYVLAGSDGGLGSLQFILTTSAAGSCPAQDDTVFVSIVAGLDPTFSYSSSTFCANDPSSTPTASTTGGYFDVVGGVGVAMNTTTGEIFPSLSTPGVYQIYHEYTAPCFAADTITITINALPAVNITPDHVACYGDTIQFLATPAGGTWSGITFGLNAVSGQWVTWLSGSGLQTVTYTFTDSNGCTAFDTNKIFIRPAPSVSITGLTGPYCPSDGPITVTGVPSGGLFFLNGVLQGVSTFVYDPTTVGTDTVLYFYQDPITTCIGFAQANVVVSSTPASPILSAVAPFEYCQSSPSTLTVTNPTSTVGWFSDAGLTSMFLTGISISTSSLPGGTNTIYVANLVGSTCASAPTPFTYTNWDESFINFGGPYITCPGTPIPINVSFTTPLVFQWFPDSSLSDYYIPNPIANPSQPTMYYIIASPSSLPSCFIYDSVFVDVQPCSLDEVTNAFSPDNDGINDTWIINGIQMHPKNLVSIFNRWGDKMVEIKDYDNVNQVWNGTYKGSLVSAGTYYFIIQYFDDGQQKAGWIQVNY